MGHVWRQLSELATASPKRWMDAYLAAFAIAAGMRLVTFDSDFGQFESMGFDLILPIHCGFVIDEQAARGG